jgi:phosphatidylserine/phosphatidylglycerophosphate/cardiolipin synthase-like enzyme
MKNILLCFIAVFIFLGASAQNKIKCYFNKPVDTTVSTGVKAAYLNNCIADTLAVYLSRAKYSIDICIYDFEKTIAWDTTTIDRTIDTVFAPKVAAAIDSAYAHGLKVRLIFDSGNANTGLTLLDTGIHTMGSPQGSAYSIMHNKLVIIDAGSPNPGDPIVWTGCLNWYYEQWNWDYNNVIIFQDSALASAYTAEFNMMWGDTGVNKNWATSKFGQFKTDLGMHNFYIDGNLVELYFSPSDGTDSHIQSTIASADKDLYFGQFTFTETTDASDIIIKQDSGLNVYGIQDNTSEGYYPIEHFPGSLGTHYKIYSEFPDSLYHNKMLIVDPSDTCSDPLVLTGSHNWSSSANTKNDENTVIVHNASIANQYLQYFKGSFDNLPGSKLTLPTYDCNPAVAPTSVHSTMGMKDNFIVYPNPSRGDIDVSYELSSTQTVTVDICNVIGQKVALLVNNELEAAGRHKSY